MFPLLSYPNPFLRYIFPWYSQQNKLPKVMLGRGAWFYMKCGGGQITIEPWSHDTFPASFCGSMASLNQAATWTFEWPHSGLDFFNLEDSGGILFPPYLPQGFSCAVWTTRNNCIWCIGQQQVMPWASLRVLTKSQEGWLPS